MTDDGGEDADRRWQWIRAMHSEAGGPVKLLSQPATFALRLCYLSIPAHLLSLGDFDPVAIVTVVTSIFDIALEPGRRRTPLVSRSTLMRISSFVRRIIGAHLISSYESNLRHMIQINDNEELPSKGRAAPTGGSHE